MRKVKIATICFLGCAAVCLCAMLYMALSSGGAFFQGGGRVTVEGDGAEISFWENGQNYKMVLEKEVDPEEIGSLKIDYGMTLNSVLFYEGEGDKIVIREFMNYDPGKQGISLVELKNGELVVRGVRKNYFSFFSFRPRNAYTEVYLPAGFAERLGGLYVKTVSGDIASEIPFGPEGDFTVSSTSGDIFFRNTGADKIQVSSTSGDIRMLAAQADEVSVSSTSGDIILGPAEGSTMMSSVSGNITVNDLKGDGKFTSTSGDIFLENVTGRLNITTTSGDVSLGQVAGDMNISTTSGETRIGKAVGNLDADTISGDIVADVLEGEFQTDSTSGEVAILGGSGCGRADTISGDVRIFLGGLTGALEVSTTSGDVDVMLPGAGSYALDFDSASGSCDTFFDDVLTFSKKGNQARGKYGTGEHAVSVSTVSGSLQIGEY